MNRELHTIDSKALGHSLDIISYGKKGRPLIIFPPQAGKPTDFEGFGMIDVIAPFIDEGKIQVYSVSSVDEQSWANTSMHPADRGRRHEDYDRAFREDLLPFIRKHSKSKLLPFLGGCSMGGYHASNFFFRHPSLFGGLISLSGVLDLSLFVGDYGDELVYLNSPLRFLANLTDEAYLGPMRKAQIVICAGRGAYDDVMCAQAEAIKPILEAKKIPALVDIWGHDVNHDWPWWRKQLPYFLGNMRLG